MEALMFILIGVVIGVTAMYWVFKSKIKSVYFTITATSEGGIEKQLSHKLSNDFPVEILRKKTYPTSTTFELKYVK